ncbi:hypothetical protein Tco_0218934 [Tanacetum coccineum]
MHVVKNVAESLMGTLFNIKIKTKDTWKSRKDLLGKGLKKSLHLVEDGNSFIMPMACYHFTKDEKQKVLNFLASIKGSLTKEARLFLNELSDFIQILCARNMYIDVLKKQEEKIVLILRKLERMFPPSFFNIMTHLLIHLPLKAKKGGPFQYHWMFSFERKMQTLKGYVKNIACPEGCITKRSLDNECLNFCSMYLNDVETNFNKVERNNEMVDIDGDISVFSCKGGLLGSKITRDISNNELEKIYTYILHNCDEMVELINEHKLKLEKEKCNNINELRDKHFASWLQERVNNCPESFESEIRLLSRGPLSVNEYSGCMVNGVSDVRGLQVDKESAAISINMSREWFIDQPYILASQAKQVFYAPDLKLGKNWHVVLSNPLYKVFNVPLGDVYQEEEPQLNLNADLNLEQSSLRRGSNLLELVDGITFSSDSTRKASKNRLLIDEENIDDEETDPCDLESSEKEGSSQEDYTDSD